jgi:hypothetical protein
VNNVEDHIVAVQADFEGHVIIAVRPDAVCTNVRRCSETAVVLDSCSEVMQIVMFQDNFLARSSQIKSLRNMLEEISSDYRNCPCRSTSEGTHRLDSFD